MRATTFLRVAVVLALALVLSACSAADAHPVVKLGVIAPFEGEGRSLGYAVLGAIKEEVAAANARGDFGAHRVMVVAFNDELNPPTAARQAEALGLDPDVMAVVGPFTEPAGAAAGSVLAEARVPFVPLQSVDLLAEEHPAGVAAAREAAGALIRALAADIAAHGQPSRAGVSEALDLP